jgi:hypothetical protein
MLGPEALDGLVDERVEAVAGAGRGLASKGGVYDVDALGSPATRQTAPLKQDRIQLVLLGPSSARR